jgi:hypothetical protein
MLIIRALILLFFIECLCGLKFNQKKVKIDVWS